MALLLIFLLECSRFLIEKGAIKGGRSVHYNRDQNTYKPIVCTIIFFHIIMLILLNTQTNANPYSCGAGIMLFVLGIILRIYSYKNLREFFNLEIVIFKEHELIISGPYYAIRHPLYTSILIIFFSYCVISASILSIVYLLCVMIPIYLNRIKVEEEEMLRVFKDKYALYQKKTKRLVPFIY
jgi:protein-S-isoprenylcysteine O-methyltransferase Ste14